MIELNKFPTYLYTPLLNFKNRLQLLAFFPFYSGIAMHSGEDDPSAEQRPVQEATLRSPKEALSKKRVTDIAVAEYYKKYEKMQEEDITLEIHVDRYLTLQM